MKIVRFESGGSEHFGVHVDLAHAKKIEGPLFGDYRVTDRVLMVERQLAPIVPTDILCVGLNYKDHAAEGGFELPQNPILFIKASNSLNHPGVPIPIPRRSSMIDYEGELVVIIGREAKNVSRAEALEHIFGYTCGNDVSARDWQREKSLGGGQFARAKSFDGFCPLGPYIVTRDEIKNPNALKIRTYLNGQMMQDSSTAQMVFDIPTLIESLSSTMTLRAGTVIMTGTPHGVGFARTPPVWLSAGDTIEVEIESIGKLSNPVGIEP